MQLSVDASSKGLGTVLLQDQKPVAYASRALTTVQQGYSQIEKELLAIVYGCQKFHQYIYGREVEVETDHRPLESIFKKPLHQAPFRLQKMLLQLQSYDLKVRYQLVDMVAMSPEKYKEFQDAASQDPVLDSLRSQVLKGWPER